MCDTKNAITALRFSPFNTALNQIFFIGNARFYDYEPCPGQGEKELEYIHQKEMDGITPRRQIIRIII